MAAPLKASGPAGAGAGALLLLGALLAGGLGGADDVTTWRCAARGAPGRLRLRGEDSAATTLIMNKCHKTQLFSLDLSGLPNIDKVDLDHNNLINFDPTLFRSVPGLTHLLLGHNTLRVLPVFVEHSCSNLTLIRLQNNLLTEIINATTFSVCLNLKYIDMRSNRIEYLHPDLFRPLTELRVLDLESNKLTFIPEKMISMNRKLSDLFLTGNRIVHLPPNIVTDLKRTGFGFQLTFEENPMICGCFLELVSELKRADAVYRSHRYDGARPACVYVGARPCCRHAPSALLRAPAPAPPRAPAPAPDDKH